MSEKEDIVSIYNSNKKSHQKQLEKFTNQLDQLESLIDDMVFELKQDGFGNIELKDDDEVEENTLKKDKEVTDIIYNTKKIFKNMHKIHGKKYVFNS